MARPSKPVLTVVGHRTRDELETRKEAEKATLTGVPMDMAFKAKNHKLAAKEFRRIKTLLGEIGKDDALYGQVINTYCLLVEECEHIEVSRRAAENDLQDLINKKAEIDFLIYLDEVKNLRSATISFDKQLMNKRRMLLDISKENIMTIASALRSVPKRPKDKAEESPMATFLKKRADMNAAR